MVVVAMGECVDCAHARSGELEAVEGAATKRRADDDTESEREDEDGDEGAEVNKRLSVET